MCSSLTLRTPRQRCAIARVLFATLLVSSATHLQPQATSALPRSTPEREGISSSAILDFVQAADSSIDAMNSFMLVRHGRVVAEGWWGPYAPATPHILYSLSKSFTSTAVGFAVAEGELSVDDQVLKYFPKEAPAEPSANLRAMRVRDLLRMVTGNQSEAALFGTVDPSMTNATWVERFLAHPVPFKPGTHFLYNSPATFMLSAIVQKVTGETVNDYLTPRLYEPLGIAKPAWVSSPEGINAGAYGLSVRTEDIAKLGLLYLQHGKWNGKQILPASWVAEATARQTSNGSAPTSDWDQGYGYQFWQSRHGFRGDGAFGQYMLILPQYDAVVAITSGVRDMQAVMNLVWDRLLPAMQPHALSENGEAQRALASKLQRLVMRVAPGQATSSIVSKVSGRWFEVPENDLGMRAVSLDFGRAPVLRVRTAGGESTTPIGLGSWVMSKGWTNGIDRALSVTPPVAIGASGGWSADSVFTVKLVAPETPFYSTMQFRFSGDRLELIREMNVSFGERKASPLVGRVAEGSR